MNKPETRIWRDATRRDYTEGSAARHLRGQGGDVRNARVRTGPTNTGVRTPLTFKGCSLAGGFGTLPVQLCPKAGSYGRVFQKHRQATIPVPGTRTRDAPIALVDVDDLPTVILKPMHVSCLGFRPA